jgi:hypothetical protein
VSAGATGGSPPRPPSGGPAPHCPACGEPLYGWAVAESPDRRAGSWILDRCEACGLGMVRDGPGPDTVLEGERDVVRVPNRRSWQAGLGGEHWAAVDPPRQPAYLTPSSLALLAGRARIQVSSVRQPALGRNQLWMWQTMLNAFTFHDGFATEALNGRLTPRNARSAPAFAVDAIVSVVAALPVALISVPLELAAVLARRGGLLEARLASRGRA